MVQTQVNTSGTATEVGAVVETKTVQSATVTLHSARSSDNAWIIKVVAPGTARIFGFASEAKAREMFAGI